jgi:Transposase DDE domain group 1
VAKGTRNLREQQVNFFRLSGKKILGAFDGGMASSYGGVIPLGELNKALGFTAGASGALRDWRRIKCKFSMEDLVTQRVILGCAGLVNTADADHFRHDPALRLAIGLGLGEDKTLASQPTMSRLDGMNRSNCYRLAVWLVMFYISIKKKVPKEIAIDVDGSCFPVHGKQQHSSYRKKYNTNMYFPLLVYDQDGWLITALLRPGYSPEVNLAYSVVKRVVSKLKKAWPDARIILRMDAGFGDARILDWCEDTGIYYVVRFNPGAGGVQNLVKHFALSMKRAFRRKFGEEQYIGTDGQKEKAADEKEAKKLPKVERRKALHRLESRRVRGYGDIEYRTGGGGQSKRQWRSDRRLATVVTHTDKGSAKIFIITNMTEPAKYIYENLYCRRGNAEQFIGQFKSALGTKLSSPHFTANQCRLLMYALSYNLLLMLRDRLPSSFTASVKTLKDHFIKIAVMITESKRQITLHWTSHYQYIREFLHVCRKLHL